MTYQDTLEWMFAQLPMYQQRGASAINLKLDNIRAFSEKLDHPEKKFKSIHVGGTNGKGSNSHMLASILQEAGYRVGLYTSPHLKDYTERIKINGQPIEQEWVVDFIDGNKAFLESRRLSFFEMSVGMAFAYFAAKQVDIAIVEVGLGGRFDSTNILVPEVSLITNIGLDHVEFLGDTLEKIAFEKAGIIKQGVPVVVSEYQDEVAPVFERVAAEKKAKLVFADRTVTEIYETSLLGHYQPRNIKGVIATLAELRGFTVDGDAIVRGLMQVVANTGLMGRWQVLGTDPLVVCDTAHNREGIELVVGQLRTQSYHSLHMVLGFVKEKNLESILPLFPVDATYYFACPAIPRGLDASVLRDRAAEFGLEGMAYSSVGEAYRSALESASRDDFIFIGGSNFTVAEVV